MGRVFKVVLYAVIILILYLWISAIMNSGKKADVKQKPTETQTDSLADQNDSDTLLQDEEGAEDGTYISNEDIVSGKIPYKDVDKTIDELSKKTSEKTGNTNTTPVKNSPQENSGKPAVQPTVVTAPTKKPEVKTEPVKTKTVNLNEDGDYLVMAGSFILEENANKTVKKLRGMGYENAGVVVFTASEYYSVVASRHATQEKAQLAADALKRKGIDCFVKKKN